MKNLCRICVALFCAKAIAAGTWTDLNYPGAVSTTVSGISSNKVVGYYTDNSNSIHGFVNDGANWTTLDPLPGFGTWIYGISGNTILAQDLLYDGTNWMPLPSPPVWGGAAVVGISDNKLVGWYIDSDSGTIPYPNRGLHYNGATWSSLNYPGAIDTSPYGISGNNIVGWYDYEWTDAVMYWHGFLYDGTTWTNLDYPGARETVAYGIDGKNIVGYYSENSETRHGFLYSEGNWTTFDIPGASATVLKGISGNNIIGYYYDSSNNEHSFLYIIPEPATVLLLGLGGLILAKKK